MKCSQVPHKLHSFLIKYSDASGQALGYEDARNLGGAHSLLQKHASGAGR